MTRVEFLEPGSQEKKKGYLITYTQVITSYKITAGRALFQEGQIMAVIEPEKPEADGGFVHKTIPASFVSIR